MILRRFMKHVTDQNWFAVGLDVIVVIVGIFLGLQVQQWNEGRAERVLERDYLVKLHTDADQLLTSSDEFTTKTRNIANQMMELSLMLLEQQDGSNFTNLHCNSLAYSHIYVTRIVSLPTLNEMLSSGQILLIRNEKIRELISNFTLLTDTTLMLLNSIQSDKLDITRKYPQFVKLKSPVIGNERIFEDISLECDYRQMVDNDEFKNDLIGNNSRYKAHVEAINTQLSVLHQLHDALAQELDITHLVANQ